MNYLTCAVTDVGISKQTNQDSYLMKSANTKVGKICFAVICDGMGGLSKGELASATVIRAFDEWFCERLPELLEFGIEDNLIQQQWVSLVKAENDKIMAYGKQQGINLGTTVCAILITPHRYYYINVGDSRLYELSDELKQITVDQTLVQREVEYGILTPEQAKVDPRRSVLLQCVGCNDTVNPVVGFGIPNTDSVYLLCSDGFRHVISEEEIYALLQPNQMLNKQQMEQNTVELIELNKQRHENDNITVLTIRTF